MRVLQIVRSAWRCTLEEQDDPVLWIAAAMRKAGAELAVLLRGNACAYALEGQDASGLSFGSHAQKHPPRPERDLAALLEGGVAVFAVAEDAAERGLDPARFVAGIESVSRAALPQLLADFDRVWHW